jgi:phosphoglycolate phosphatase-like HAD superfamily hydrolase
MKALIFDCDGVLVDTERDGHRVAFNRAFEAAGIDAEWDVDLYGELLKIAGGKERMTHYFNEAGWPEGQTAARRTRRAFGSASARHRTRKRSTACSISSVPNARRGSRSCSRATS